MEIVSFGLNIYFFFFKFDCCIHSLRTWIWMPKCLEWYNLKRKKRDNKTAPKTSIKSRVEDPLFLDLRAVFREVKWGVSHLTRKRVRFPRQKGWTPGDLSHVGIGREHFFYPQTGVKCLIQTKARLYMSRKNALLISIFYTFRIYYSLQKL